MDTTRKDNAIALRRKGKTYSEIRNEINVSKSTLSMWLKSVGLATAQKQIISKKRKAAQLRGASARRANRLHEIDTLLEQGKKDISSLTSRELWLIGTALYWAEGSKQGKKNLSSGVIFANSDLRMHQVFLSWLRFLKVPDDEVYFELFVHTNRKGEIPEFRKWWAQSLKVSPSRVEKVYLKLGNPKTKRAAVDDLYRGLLRIRVKASTSLNRQINGWVEGIVAAMGDRLMVGHPPLKR